MKRSMTNMDDIQHLLSNIDQRRKSSGRNVLIIALFDDEQKILSSLKSQTMFLNSNDRMITRTSPNNEQTNKRSTDQLLNEDSKEELMKKRKSADLTCVICGGRASGYNFNQITCESCKAFFRRNALHSIKQTKCLNQIKNFNSIQCPIRHEIKNKCQRCRLFKCFQSGMRKDRISTPEEKLSKQQRLEENRRLCSIQISNHEIPDRSPRPSKSSEPIDLPSAHLTEADQNCLNSIRNAYANALQSVPPVSLSLPLELPPDKMSAYMNTLDIQNYAALKIINFLRQIPEFEQIDEKDRLILVKHNLPAIFSVRYASTFDPTREIFYYDTPTDVVSPTEEAFAQHYKSLYILCYGYELNCSTFSLIRSIYDLIHQDTTLTPLLMLNLIFLKGISANDDQEPSLSNYQKTFDAHAKYTDLLFRYLIERFSFDGAVRKMMRITEIFIKIQRIMIDFQQFIKSKVDMNYVNPLMKSLLNLT